jgi:1-acyl-sn-glycerol-3-phosphate acyltransferase
VVDGHEVRIVDPSGQEVGDRIVGELQFRGPSSTSGYRGNADATSELFCDGWLRSGDLAYRVDGEIFITGRVKDLIIRAGRNIAPQDLEQVVALVSGVRAGGVGAFAVTTEQGEQIVVAVETKLESPADQAELIERIQQRLSSEMGLRADVVLPLKPRRLPKTSSGKIRRGDCRRLYSSGELGRSRSVAWQMVELSVRARGLRMMSWFRRAKVVSYGTWAGVSFIALLTILFLLLSLVQSTARRRSLLKRGAKLWFALIGIPLRVDGKEPSTTETIFVPNHASYLDAVVLTAVLPPTVRFVAKRDFEKHPLMRRLLKFADVVYVERSELGRAATDGAALYSVVRSGESIAIFPEGTFWRTPGLLPFRMGAFLMAARTGRSVTPVAIRGTRNILPDGNWLLRPGSITVTCLAALIPTGTEWGDAVRLRDAARERLLSAVGEPDRS